MVSKTNPIVPSVLKARVDYIEERKATGGSAITNPAGPPMPSTLTSTSVMRFPSTFLRLTVRKPYGRRKVLLK
ncbi:hypothetical protein J6590_082645 [Homalodisca vitripennis]|nr:hypothetical protein J6590_082645 [Homalodisca vitripennis]